jgi:hypothetical protein
LCSKEGRDEFKTVALNFNLLGPNGRHYERLVFHIGRGGWYSINLIRGRGMNYITINVHVI